jgi:hypothetical protein
MKKFSTAFRAIPALVLASALCTLPASAAGTQNQQSDQSTACAFRTDAPDQHRVVKGDTLWDISGRFLAHPWCWPQVWGLNRNQIRDPHWIYPGQVIVFDRTARRLRLGDTGSAGSASGTLPEIRLSPQTRIEALGPQAIASIPAGAIEPFLTEPLIVEQEVLASGPRVVATAEGHISAGLGDKIFVRGDLKEHTSFQVFRPARPLKDPVTNDILGYESAYLGVVRLDRRARAENEAHRFVVASSREEIGPGAHLLPVPKRLATNYVPHAPATAIEGRIVSVYGGLTQAGRNNVVVINRGAGDGIDPGTVLHLYRLGRMIKDPQAGPDQPLIKLPDENYGTLFVFRVFDKLSYGLVMQVTDAVRINDPVRSPE